MRTSVGHALDYIIGIFLFGLMWGILNLSMSPMATLLEAGDLKTIANVFWYATLVIYLIFGAFWLPRKIKEWDYYYGGR